MVRILAALGVFIVPVSAVVFAAYLLTPAAPPAPHTPSLPDAVLAALRQADRIQIVSLDPTPAAADDRFHGWQVLGRVTLDGKQAGPDLAAALAHGAAEGGPSFLCFDPRHGVRLSGPNGVVDLVLCFECGNAEVHGLDGVRGFGTGPSPAAALNRLLAEQGVPLAVAPRR